MDNHPEKFYIRLAGKLDSSPVAFDRRIIGQMLKSHPERPQELRPENGNSDWGSPASFGFTPSPEIVGDTHPSWTPAITSPATASVSPTVTTIGALTPSNPPREVRPAESLKCERSETTAAPSNITKCSERHQAIIDSQDLNRGTNSHIFVGSGQPSIFRGGNAWMINLSPNICPKTLVRVLLLGMNSGAKLRDWVWNLSALENETRSRNGSSVIRI